MISGLSSWVRTGVAALLVLFACPAADSALERGLEAFRRRDFTAAEREFQQLVREQPSSARAHKLLGMTYVASERYEFAEEPLRRACALDPREENACYYLGRAYFTLGRLEQSRQAYEEALRQGVDKRRVLLGMALTLEAMARPEQAERFYKDAIRAGEARALVDYGLFLFKQDRGAESLEVLRQAGAKAELERVQKALRSRPRASHASLAPVPVRFEPTALDMVVNNGATGDKHLVETMIAGAAVFDYDGDGWPDVYIANGATIPSLEKVDASFHNRLFRNNHDGTFSDVTRAAGVAGEGYSMGVAAADYDNDGHVDLFVTGVGANILYRNRGDGTFENVTARAGLGEKGRWSVAAGWFDYDNDGLLDLFVVRYVDWDTAKEIYCGLPQPGHRQYCHPQHYQPLASALYHNEGAGRFRDVSRESGIAAHPGKGMGVAFGDYDGDGRLDVFVANDSMPNSLFHNKGGGRFEESALAAGVAYNDDGMALSSMGVDFRDYDNDGREDLFVTALSNETFPLFRNMGGVFADMTHPSGIGRASLPWAGWSAGMFDFNNDGFKDIFCANGHVMDNAELTSGRQSRQPNLVFVNRGDGRFDVQKLPGEALHRGAAFGDFDRDGRVDVLVTRLNEQPVVLRNRSATSFHWIALRLVGTRSNRDGIGALVHLTTGAGEQWNRVTTSVGYGCSSDRIVHFGLGGETAVRRIEIAWPSGTKQVLENVPADRRLTIRED